MADSWIDRVYNNFPLGKTMHARCFQNKVFLELLGNFQRKLEKSWRPYSSI